MAGHRKQNVGLVFANQRLANIENQKVRNALSGMAIKFAGTSDADDGELAALTSTTADHIRHLPRGTFSAYVSGVTSRGVDLKFPLSPLEDAPRMSRGEWQTMRRAMRDRYAVRYRSSDSPPQPPSETETRAKPTRAPKPEAPPDQWDSAPIIEGTVVRPALRPPRPPSADDDYDPLQ